MRITPKNLSKATNISFAKFDHFRQARMKMMTQMVGRFYHGIEHTGDDAKASPLNLLYSAVGTLVPNLVFNDPKYKVNTLLLAQRGYAEELGLGLDYLAEGIRLKDSLRKTIFDAIFMAGFMKTGIASEGEYLKWEGHDCEIGRPFAERVDPDDIILDPMARDWDEQTFIGNRYRVDLDVMLESGLYDNAILEKLSGRYDEKVKGAEGLSGDKATEYQEITRHIDLVDLYLPREKVVVTLPFQRNAEQDAFLRVAEYAGPDRGPYHMLGFTPVSDNILPVAPAGIWYDLHMMGNKIARKLGSQAERMKSVLAYEGEAAEDAKNIVDSNDGSSVRVNYIDKIKEVKYGGATPEAYEWMEWVKRNFSEMAGSIEMLSGVGSNVPTATQAEMLQANTSVRLGDMQNMVYGFAGDVGKDLGYYAHTDPLMEIPLIKRVQGMEQQVYLTPDSRIGQWYDFNISVKPYSMARPDPNMAVRRKLEFATNVIPAAAQAAALLGPGFMVGPFLRKMATDVGIDDADEFINDIAFQQWILQRAMMDTGDPGKAGAGINMPQMGGINPNPGQPAPSMRGPQGGISTDTETAMAQQETAGELQAGGQPSARALALSRG